MSDPVGDGFVPVPLHVCNYVSRWTSLPAFLGGEVGYGVSMQQVKANETVNNELWQFGYRAPDLYATAVCGVCLLRLCQLMSFCCFVLEVGDVAVLSGCWFRRSAYERTSEGKNLLGGKWPLISSPIYACSWLDSWNTRECFRRCNDGSSHFPHPTPTTLPIDAYY